jgi:hypothetical protein
VIAAFADAEGEAVAMAGDFATGLNPTVERRAGVSGAAVDDAANDDERAMLEEDAVENEAEALKDAPARIMRSSEGVLAIEKGSPPSLAWLEFVAGLGGGGASADAPGGRDMDTREKDREVESK